METGAASLRRGRVVHAALALVILFYVYLSEFLAPPDAKVSSSFVVSIAIFACVIALIAYQIRRKKLQPAMEKLRQDPNDSEALKNWRAASIAPSILAESIGLFGFVLRFMGAGRGVSWPFFLASLVLLAMWRPRMDWNARRSKSPAVQ